MDHTAPLTPRQQAAMDFLMTHLPLSDLDTYPPTLFLQFADHALALRESAPWCAAADEEIFLHYVLFPRVNDEDLSFHREIFRSALWDRICDLPTVEEKILAVNRWCHEMASYEMQDERTASPLTVYRSGSGRCGEESAFLVSALRSVGIPARQIYVPRWAHCDDNHAWVEALCGDKWRFLGACEPEPILDRGWFNASASRAVLVHSRLFGEGSHPLHGERISTRCGVTWFNQTARYAPVKRQTVRVTAKGRAAAGAVVSVMLLNEASFHTVADLTADETGTASLDLGIGSIRISARLGDLSAACDCMAGEEVTLSLAPFSLEDSLWHESDYIAPAVSPINPAPLTDKQKEIRRQTLAEGRAMREARIAAMRPEEAAVFPRLSAARGNAGEILRFLSRSSDPLRKAMVDSLSDKDLRDVTEDILESHFIHLTPRGKLPEQIYIPYVLCPRIDRERLTSWREELRRIPLTDPAVFLADPRSYLCLSEAATYENLVWSPADTLRGGRCDDRSLRILSVAFLRAHGIPARLRHEDGTPEFFRDGTWHGRGEGLSSLTLTTDTAPVYKQDFTVSRRQNGTWQLMCPGDTDRCDVNRAIPLLPGQYRIITSVRMPGGDQFAARRDLSLTAGESLTLPLHFRSYALSDLLRRQRLPAMDAVTDDGTRIPDICLGNGRPTLLLWLEEGGEPTEHVLNELIAEKDAWNRTDIDLFFLLRTRAAIEQRTVAAALAALPAVRLLWDDWAFDLEQAARHLTCDPDAPPLAVLCDRDGHTVYAAGGYSVGSVSLLRRVAEYLCSNQ